MHAHHSPQNDCLNIHLIGENDLFNVKEEVMELASRWKDLGLALRLQNPTLETISSKNNRDPEDCLRDMLLAWLRGQYDTKQFGQPSWELLCQAVEKRAGGNNPALAGSIRKRHGI